MTAILVRSNYGKCRVRLAKVTRRTARHDFKDLTVDVAFEGEFDEVHRAGDNSSVLPTDTMKNTVYALAASHPLDEIEDFASALVGHFLEHNAQASRVRVRVAERLWTRIDVSGEPHRHAFTQAHTEERTAEVTSDRRDRVVESGIDGLLVLKTTGSGFEGFLKDRFTTLPESSDRILATAVRATWRYCRHDVPFGERWEGVRRTILEVFATHESRSVQYTLFHMGQEALERYGDIAEIRLSLPNKHHIPFNLAPLGLESSNEIFVPTEEPYGLIEATVARASAPAPLEDPDE